MAHEGQKIAGEYWVLKLSEDAGTTWLQLICEKGADFKSTRDEIDGSSKCGDDKSPGKRHQSLTSEFFLIQGANVLTTEASYKKIYEWWVSGLTLYVQFGPAATTLPTGELRHTTRGWIKSVDVSAKYGDRIGCNLDMVIYSDDTVLNVGA